MGRGGGGVPRWWVENQQPGLKAVIHSIDAVCRCVESVPIGLIV